MASDKKEGGYQAANVPYECAALQAQRARTDLVNRKHGEK